jgi:hypothetical protein
VTAGTTGTTGTTKPSRLAERLPGSRQERGPLALPGIVETVVKSGAYSSLGKSGKSGK